MKTLHRIGYLFFLLAMVAGSMDVSAVTIQDLESFTGGRLDHHTARATGAYDFIRATGSAVLSADNAAVSADRRALAFLRDYGALLGLSDLERQAIALRLNPVPLQTIPAVSEVRVFKSQKDSLNKSHVKLRQYYLGIPVYGAELAVHMDQRGIYAVNGSFVPAVSLQTTPGIHSSVAIAAASAAVRKLAPGSQVTAGTPQLMVYRTGLLAGVEGSNRLAYSVVVTAAPDLREQVFIDAVSGAVLDRITLNPHARNRVVYSPQYNPANPDLFVLRREGDPPTNVPPVDNLYDFSGEVYDFFFNGFGRDSYDGKGITMRTVYLINNNCPNAYWNGTTTNYCPGFDADDVVAHEWGHAYSEYTHDLIYSYQSGALNESYSDVWGETIDLHNGRDGVGGSNNEQVYPDGQRWMIIEDLAGPDQTVLIRDMWDPERLNNPSKVSSGNYYCAADDGGGVHTNSGVPNHAFAILVDGKTFNGQTVEGIGFNKATHIYFRAMTQYQTRTTNFAQHDQALKTSCQDLTGVALNPLFPGLPVETITASDCEQLAKAMLAVEMSAEPVQCNFQPLIGANPPAVCAGASTFYSENFETGIGNWTLASAGLFPEWPNFNWEVVSSLPQGKAGSAAFAVDPRGGTCAPGGDYSGQYHMDSPAIVIPANAAVAQLRFDHFAETELGYDGGNLKYSVNGGLFQLVPQESYVYSAPQSELNSAVSTAPNTNPMGGEFAWHGANGGKTTGSWGTTVVDLMSLAAPGDSIQLRYDFGMDGCNGTTGWFVDDISAYTCPGLSAPAQNPIADDATPDQQNGIDKDGRFVLSWTYPPPPAQQACGFRVEEAGSFGVDYSDDAEELLVLGSNSRWTGDANWASLPHAGTATMGYSLVYTDNLNTSLTIANAIALPAGSAARLSFDSEEDIEEGYDSGFVEVSANGSAFQPLATYTGAFSGTRTVDLSAYAGQSVHIRFRFESDNIFAFPLYTGWSIDNIRIERASDFQQIAVTNASTTSYNVSGRANGDYAYRIAGLFGDCAASPNSGPYSNVEQISVNLAPQTSAPVAEFTASPNPADVNQAVTFDGSASQDSDTIGNSPAIVSYRWSFGDGSSHTGSTPVTQHAYTQEGTYRATLTVTDNDGETASTEQLIQVVAPQPQGGRVSGGGHIPVQSKKANFGFDVTSTGGQVSGSLMYHDKAAGVKVTADSAATLTFNGNAASFTAPCSVNKNAGFTCTVDVVDNGNSNDTFRIRISNGYDAGGTLSGGNISVEQQ